MKNKIRVIKISSNTPVLEKEIEEKSPAKVDKINKTKVKNIVVPKRKTVDK